MHKPLLVAIVGLLVAGCVTDAPAPSVTVGDVTYVLPSGASTMVVSEDSVHYSSDAVDFRVDDNRRMLVNSVPYGRLWRGDYVELTPAGMVLVNGAERRAVRDVR